MPSLKSIAALAAFALAAILPPSASAQDWPTWRHDAGRTGATGTPLAEELHLQWTRDLQPPRPAFPTEVRLRFDAGYEPVAVGTTLFVPSMVTDSVTALDTETGFVRWRFFADGPIRFAPLVHDGRVYVSSDDGRLYCLSADGGKVIWTRRGLPDGRKDRKILGNRRLVSLWPARGGAVLADGTIYFAAGVWPDDGVFIHALDAATGKTVWLNSDSNRIPKANMDHGVAQYAGLTPQGYLAVVNDKLVVPCGAQLAALLDLKSGAVHDYTMGWGGRVGLPKGSWFAAGAGPYLSHSGDLYDLARPNDEKFRQPRRGGEFKNMLYPGGFTRFWIDPTNQRALGAVRQPIITRDSMIYNDHEKGVVAYDLTDVKLVERKTLKPTKARANDKYPDKWKGDLMLKWSLSSSLEAHVRAGNRVYLGGKGAVEAVDIPEDGAEPKVSWKAGIEGTPHRMIAAAGKLFVTTLEGRLYAFGDQPRARMASHALLKPSARTEDEWTARAKEILKTTGATEGYALVLGLEKGRLVDELIRQSKLTVIAVDPDPAVVRRLRETLHRAGLYGTRATALAGDPSAYPFPPYLASLVVSEEKDARFSRGVLQTLRPYGGTACLEANDATVKALREAAPADSSVRKAGRFALATRSGPLPDAADWSHAGANAANSGASQDRFLKAPLGLLWYDGSVRWQRNRGTSVVRVSEGRLFIKADRLHAFDVYTGRPLWTVKLPGSDFRGSDMVAAKSGIYVAGGETCLVLDPVDGRKTGEFKIPEGTSGKWSNIRIDAGLLVATVGRHLVCVDGATGRPVWTFRCGRASLSVAVGGGRVYCAELVNARRGETAKKAGLKTRAFDLRTGEAIWELTAGHPIQFSETHDLLVASAGVFRGEDGKRVHDGIPSGQISGGQLISGRTDSFTVYDLKTGERKGEELKWYRRGCTGLRSSQHIVTTRFKGNAAYVDLETREITPLWNIRSGCNNNLFPANGVLNVPNVTGGCECNYTPTSKALAPLSEIDRVGGDP